MLFCKFVSFCNKWCYFSISKTLSLSTNLLVCSQQRSSRDCAQATTAAVEAKQDRPDWGKSRLQAAAAGGAGWACQQVNRDDQACLIHALEYFMTCWHILPWLVPIIRWVILLAEDGKWCLVVSAADSGHDWTSFCPLNTCCMRRKRGWPGLCLNVWISQRVCPFE